MKSSSRAMRAALHLALPIALSLATLASCGTHDSYPVNPSDVVGGDRPATVYRPFDYDPDVAYPLVVLLHGYATNAFVQDAFFGTSTRVDGRKFLLVIPEGTYDDEGKRYWNAGPCCAFGPNPPDDVTYLTGLVDEVSRTHHVDARRVYLLGHSNGAAMSVKLACEAPERFAAVASLAGIGPVGEADCPATDSPVSLLAMHGDADDVVLYGGTPVPTGIILSAYPSADELARRFARRNGCDDAADVSGASFDLASETVGAETTPTRWESGCTRGTSVELWTIAGGSHIPFFVPDGTDRVLDWLFAHER